MSSPTPADTGIVATTRFFSGSTFRIVSSLELPTQTEPSPTTTSPPPNPNSIGAPDTSWSSGSIRCSRLPLDEMTQT